jgi:signal transduction histidine kinase
VEARSEEKVSRLADDATERILILAPVGRDADMVRERLVEVGLSCEVCGDLEALLTSMARAPAGAALIAEEALVPDGDEALLARLDAQEPWSDLPVFLLVGERSRRGGGRSRDTTALFEGANVMLLERPMRVQLLVSAVRAAVRARRRQYDMRDLLRERQQAVQLSDMFVSILAHDLRTPLGAIKLTAELLADLPEEDRLRPAARILSSVGRMTTMIDQLLDFARIRQGRGIPLDRRVTDLAEVCHAVVDELQDAHPQARITVQVKGGLTGEWDPDRIAQVVSNLAANAVQHGVRGAPVAVEVDGTAPGSIAVRVHNEGRVPDALLSTLFEVFKGAAVAHGNRSSRNGLGMGLFIAREIARAHGGDITARSSDDEGTTFEVVLPRRQRAGEPSAEAPLT